MIISDVCNTLFYANTTFDFILFILKKEDKPSQARTLKQFSRKWSLWFIVDNISNRLFGFDFAKSFALSKLKGYTREELIKYAVIYFEEELNQKKIKPVFERIKDIGDAELFLASASIDPVVEVIAKKLNAIGYISSKLQYDDRGLCTGKIEYEMKGKKSFHLKDKINTWSNVTVFSDNHSDRDLMNAASQKIAISYTAKSDYFWTSLGCDLIKP